jgi:hypothetical protein
VPRSPWLGALLYLLFLCPLLALCLCGGYSCSGMIALHGMSAAVTLLMHVLQLVPELFKGCGR